METYTIETVEQLEALYRSPPKRLALLTEIDHLNEAYRSMVRLSPFVVLSSVGTGGVDVSPRGGPPGFVIVQDDRTLLIPDKAGNNRIDTMRNVIVDPRVGLMFFIPGYGNLLRIHGRAKISADPQLLARFATDGPAPVAVLVISIDSAFYQCKKSIDRSMFWRARISREAVDKLMAEVETWCAQLRRPTQGPPGT